MSVTVSDAAAAWLATGERGLSSEALFSLTVGLDIRRNHRHREWSHPSDPDDFQRCERMLRAVPEARANLDAARVTPEWVALLDSWAVLVAALESEVPGVFEGKAKRGMAYKTYAMMKGLGA